MIRLYEWKEFGFENSPSIRTVFQNTPYPEKEDVIRYLQKGRVYLAAFGVGKDAFTGDIVMPVVELRTDGEYRWDSMIEYYVSKYNMRLPESFERKAVKASKK